jgi:hypothetical protein
VIVGIAGIPASGKSTFALALAQAISITLAGSSAQAAILVGLDGWHYPRAELDIMPDPKLAHDRRGAHWTFNGPSYVNFFLSRALIRSLHDDITHSTPMHLRSTTQSRILPLTLWLSTQTTASSLLEDYTPSFRLIHGSKRVNFWMNGGSFR